MKYVRITYIDGSDASYQANSVRWDFPKGKIYIIERDGTFYELDTVNIVSTTVIK